jgi:hypothetical protein
MGLIVGILENILNEMVQGPCAHLGLQEIPDFDYRSWQTKSYYEDRHKSLFSKMAIRSKVGINVLLLDTFSHKVSGYNIPLNNTVIV